MSKNKRFTVTKKEKQAKIALVMREFASGKLTSGGKPVKSRQQALAIALSEAGMSMKKKDASEAYLEAYVDVFMEERGDAESFAPPSSVRAAARRGLELRKKHGKGGLSTQEAGKQGIGSGVARATTLASGKKVSYAMIKRMAAFFSRHEKNKSGGEDDAGFISNLLWGGSAGRAWANRIISMVESRNKKND
jgi:hypothetical protein